MHKGTFLRAAIRARKRTHVHLRAETLRAEKIGALSDPEHYGGQKIRTVHCPQTGFRHHSQ